MSRRRFSGNNLGMLRSKEIIEKLGPPYWHDWLISILMGLVSIGWLIDFGRNLPAILTGGPVLFFGESVIWSADPAMFALAMLLRVLLALVGLAGLWWSTIVVRRYLAFRNR